MLFNKKQYFEGWYYKIFDRDGRHGLAIIPGLSLVADQDNSHAFIQIFKADRCETAYHSFPLSEFNLATDKFNLQLGRNQFTLAGLTLDLADKGETVSGELKFSGAVPWPVKLFSPGAMGWYAFLPFLECYHGILSFDHGIEGSLTVNGQTIDYTGGRGYLEKDWGRSMPSDWFWLQSNHFGAEGVSLSVSIARIPWFKLSFIGFIIGFYHQGTLYRFTTYTGAKIRQLLVQGESARLKIEDKQYCLEIEAKSHDGVLLAAPVAGEMKGRVKESLSAEVWVRLSRKDGQVVFQGLGKNAGMESVGIL